MNSVRSEIVMYPKLQRAQGMASLSTKQRDAKTCLDTLFQDGCCKVRLPNTHAPSLEAVLINTAGGLTGGDTLQWQAEVAEGGHLVMTTQACERSYRSTGDVAHVDIALAVGENAHLDWLPQETILYDASKLDRRLHVNLASRATLTAVEAVLLGRDAMGEQARNAMLRDNWRISRNGRLIHAEATALTGKAGERDSLSLLAGNSAFATIVHIAADAEHAQRLLTRLRPHFDATSPMALSAIGERLVIRAMAKSGLALRRMIVPVLIDLSGAGSLPRLWHL